MSGVDEEGFVVVVDFFSVVAIAITFGCTVEESSGGDTCERGAVSPRSFAGCPNEASIAWSAGPVVVCANALALDDGEEATFVRVGVPINENRERRENELGTVTMADIIIIIVTNLFQPFSFPWKVTKKYCMETKRTFHYYSQFLDLRHRSETPGSLVSTALTPPCLF